MGRESGELARAELSSLGAHNISVDLSLVAKKRCPGAATRLSAERMVEEGDRDIPRCVEDKRPSRKEETRAGHSQRR